MAATEATTITPADGDTTVLYTQYYDYEPHPRGTCRQKSGLSAGIRQVTCCGYQGAWAFREVNVPSYLQTRCRHQPPFLRPRPDRTTTRFVIRMPARSGTSSSSMHTATSFSSSTFALNSSPSRQSPNRQSPSRHGRAHRSSIARDPRESPHRQLSVDFNLILSLNDRNLNEKLDLAAAERAKIHAEQLAKAAEEHARVRRSAQLEIDRLELVALNERLDREEKERRENERLQQEAQRKAAEVRRMELEAKQREENAARQAAEHERKVKEAEEHARMQREQVALQEKQKKDKEEADRKAAETAAAAAKAQQAQQSKVVPTPASQPVAAPAAAAPQTASSSQDSGADVEQIHAKYLELHLRMKAFRVAFWDEHKKQSSPLKGPIGDARRAIRTRLGQINVERKDSIAAIKRLREECFNKAIDTGGPMIDIRPYIVSHEIPQLSNDAEAAYPAMLLYVWICFEKFLLKQFEKEAANEDGRIIQEIGLIAASLLGDQKYMWKGIPMTDITLAKLHRACPPLFGIRGTMDNVAGRTRLGLMPNMNVDAYAQRLRGIGAGWAAMTLRTFSGKNSPALPVAEYWRAVVSICNTPADALYPGHFAILNGLIRDYYKKFLVMYGVPARAVLRRATIDLPARAPARCKDAAAAVRVLPEGWKKEKILME